ncbi:MAG: hypothetical protein J6Q22_21620 [Prevotella sp.]|nr:hypothetical protein [Prevotella sp.]
MKWDITQQWIDNSMELLMLVLKYSGYLIDDKGNKLQRLNAPKVVDDEDKQKAHDYIVRMNPKEVVNELESYLTCDTKHDVKVFGVWMTKLVEGQRLFCILDSILKSGRKAPESWVKIGGWECYFKETKDIDEYVWLIAVELDHKFDSLWDETNSIARTYGFEEKAIEIPLLIRNDSKLIESEEYKPISQRAKSIYNIIQCENKDGFVKRLHILIDGKKGKDIAVVFIRAKIDGLITRYPTKGELDSEFDWHGSWQSIEKVLQRDWDNGVLDAANAIRFN